MSATCVRVPVFYGHSEAVAIETQKGAERGGKRAKSWRGRRVVELVDEATRWRLSTQPADPTPTEASDPESLPADCAEIPPPAAGPMLWVVADNIRKGAALNAVQIAEVLVKSYW